MKKILLGLFLTASFNVMAAPVWIYPSCSYSMNNGQCTLVNNSGKDVNCSIQVEGTTRDYRTIRAWENRFLYAGQMAWINVNSTFDDPITSLRGTANCNTTN